MNINYGIICIFSFSSTGKVNWRVLELKSNNKLLIKIIGLSNCIDFLLFVLNVYI